ncbi:hypothetical protein D9M69_583320 [compost metagenome]
MLALRSATRERSKSRSPLLAPRTVGRLACLAACLSASFWLVRMEPEPSLLARPFSMARARKLCTRPAPSISAMTRRTCLHATPTSPGLRTFG